LEKGLLGVEKSSVGEKQKRYYNAAVKLYGLLIGLVIQRGPRPITAAVF
jgi:hypothetical protein